MGTIYKREKPRNATDRQKLPCIFPPSAFTTNHPNWDSSVADENPAFSVDVVGIGAGWVVVDWLLGKWYWKFIIRCWPSFVLEVEFLYICYVSFFFENHDIENLQTGRPPLMEKWCKTLLVFFYKYHHSIENFFVLLRQPYFVSQCSLNPLLHGQTDLVAKKRMKQDELEVQNCLPVWQQIHKRRV